MRISTGWENAPSDTNEKAAAGSQPQNRNKPAARVSLLNIRIVFSLIPSRSGKLVFLEALAKCEFGNLAGRRVWDLIDEGDIIGQPPFRDLAFDMGQHLLAGKLGARLPDHNKQWSLVPLWMGQADGGRLEHAGAAHRDILEFDR